MATSITSTLQLDFLRPEPARASPLPKTQPEDPPGFRFYLGTHHPGWLSHANVPLFVSRRRLTSYRTLPRAIAPWALDSGGFTELSTFGRWTVTPRAYAADVRRFRDQVGHLQWAAIQDWMCEPEVMVKTGLDEATHQRLTIENYLELKSIASDLPWTPVLQGWTIGSHWRHLDDYARAGIDLTKEPIVGIGTICRRQHMLSANVIVAGLPWEDLRLHAFGVKSAGLQGFADKLASSDSLAWSTNARRNPQHKMDGCTHERCNNCIAYALDWRAQLLSSLTPHAARMENSR